MVTKPSFACGVNNFELAKMNRGAVIGERLRELFNGLAARGGFKSSKETIAPWAPTLLDKGCKARKIKP